MLVAVAIAPLAAHEHATGIVKERMDGMEAIGKAMKAINARIKANRELGSITEDALRAWELATRMPSWFPPGSNAHPSEAKSLIWQRWPDFQAKASALETELGKLAAVANTGDPKAVAAQFRAVNQACGNCHELYRVRKK